jgi:vanillate monooxygenase ferredoxin subunit
MDSGVEARASRPSSIMTFEVQVDRITRETPDIAAFALVHPDGSELPSFTAGAHIDVQLSSGLRRQYSLCNDPRERHRYVIAVLREEAGRGGSKAMHDELAVGHRLTISGPRNTFPLAGREARLHLLLAGGIGVTPMMAMIAELEARGASWRMHYCTRSLERTAFVARLQPLIDAGTVTLHHDDGDPARGLDLRAVLRTFALGTHVYVCGPPGFMAAANAAFGAWPPHTVHREYFSPPEEPPAGGGAAFQVQINRTGQVFDVPAGRSIVAVLREHGFDIATDCEEGYCGTCITPYLAGDPDHRDTVLDHAQRGRYVMICCARAHRSPLVLDL